MAGTAPQLKTVIHRYVDKLAEMGISVQNVMLFGSHAAGTAREGSDIDLLVVSSDWAEYSQRQRLELLGIAAARILEPIQAQGFTPEEIDSDQLTPFWDEILKEHAIPV